MAWQTTTGRNLTHPLNVSGFRSNERIQIAAYRWLPLGVARVWEQSIIEDFEYLLQQDKDTNCRARKTRRLAAGYSYSKLYFD